MRKGVKKCIKITAFFYYLFDTLECSLYTQYIRVYLIAD